jgi:hypothetical protein
VLLPWQSQFSQCRSGDREKSFPEHIKTDGGAVLTQPDLQPMDGAVVLEWEGEWPRGDLRTIELRRRDASLHALRVLDHDLVS